MRNRQRERTFRRLLYLFLIVRLAMVGVTISNPTGGLMADSQEYLALAAELLETGTYGIPSDTVQEFIRPPAYAGLLAGIQLILGPEIYNITMIQLVLSSLTCLLILSLGTQLARPTAGLFGAWLYALSPNVALWSLAVMTEVPFAFGLTLIAWVSLKAVKRSIDAWAVGSGFQLGLLAYLRPIGLMLLPAWSIATIWGSSIRASKRKGLAAAAVLTFVGLLTILPWAYRNWSMHGNFTFSTVTTKTWEGFNLAQVVARGEGIDRNTAVGLLDQEIGTLQLTLDVIKNYPIEFVESQLLGVVRAAAGTELGTWGLVLDRDGWIGFGLLGDGGPRSIEQALSDAIDRSGEDNGMRFALNVYSLLFSMILIGLAAIGILKFRSSDAPERLIFSSAMATVLILLLIPGAAGQARFRVPAEPYLALLAGYGWLALSYRLRREGRSLESLDTREELIHAN